MPPFVAFEDAAAHLTTLLHEAAHATGATHRLDRNLTGRFGSAAYAAEECVAELTASFILADLGIAHRPRPDHAAYIASWLEVLKDDPRAIFTAASKAQAAVLDVGAAAAGGRRGLTAACGRARRADDGGARLPPEGRVVPPGDRGNRQVQAAPEKHPAPCAVVVGFSTTEIELAENLP